MMDHVNIIRQLKRVLSKDLSDKVSHVAINNVGSQKYVIYR